MQAYQPVLISFEEAQKLRHALGSGGLIGRTLAAQIERLENYRQHPLVFPGHGEAGGIEHNHHKQNYIHLNLAGRLFLITGNAAYRDFALQILSGYADLYPTLGNALSKDSNPPGRLFHQTLNENMWLLYGAEAYSCIRHTLMPEQREHIENNLLREMVYQAVVIHANEFDIVHNHGLWSVAAVGICGYVLNDQEMVDNALYGLRRDSVSGGFLAQLTQLFSPDGYYMEGPYYHRFAIRPLMMFAEAIARRQPELDIYQFNHQVIKRTSDALMATAFPDGTLPALNDSSKSMDINDEGIVIATSVCFARYQQPDVLIAMAQHQGEVWVSAAGLHLSIAAEQAAHQQFNWGSVVLNDGADGQQGGVGILRQLDAESDLNMALLWFGQHGSDAQLHSALDHGHFDGLHLSLFNRGREYLRDYGFGRWVNVEPKFGGRYIPENKSYCKQTIAHNTVTVDGCSQNNGDTETAQQRWGELHFVVREHAFGQGISAIARDYYPGVDMQRSVLMLKLAGFAKPLIVDLFRLTSHQSHQYDYALHYQGQIVRTDFDYQTHSTLSPLGEQHGYQHLWELGRAHFAQDRSVLVSWLDGNSYYSYLCALPAGGNVIFANIGANDPHFNLRNEPALVIRSQGENKLFASVYETHGYFNEATESSTGARGQVERVEVVGHDDDVSVVRLYLQDQRVLMIVVCNRPLASGPQVSEYGAMFHWNGLAFRWQGAFSVQWEPLEA
ncbi:chondroitin lyase [Chania multitudinisentens RB-25]|uniref:Chondroitin lyase n=1 Tax=Chania multitudinisentens RB-25 TaxID=1441930 RepID=W0LIV3_9GAMM|nr:heparinase II/III family protein [Chania multitudinisentens]AHG21900.1 chondroitin lyase [Chania multitudinisentens RB-25]